MQRARVRARLCVRHAAAIGASGVVALLLAACAAKPPELVAPRQLVAPYDSARGEPLWAVAPVRNESGTSAASSEAMSDKIVAAIQEVQGLRALPLNRTIDAMRALRMNDVRTPGEARRLAGALGADGIVVGTITAYDPYTPTIGLTLALFTGAGPATMNGIDARAVGESPTGEGAGPRWGDRPAAVTALHLDAKNNAVLMDVRAFAEGRLNGPSAAGWRRYLATADLFGEFVAHHAVDALLREEWVRSARSSGTPASGAAAPAGSGSRRAEAER